MDDNTLEIGLAIYSSIVTIAVPLIIYINRVSSARAIRRMNSYEEGMELLLSAMSKAVNNTQMFINSYNKENYRADKELQIAKNSVEDCHKVFENNRGKLLQSLKIGVSPIFVDYSVCLMSSLDTFEIENEEVDEKRILDVNLERYSLMYKMYSEAHTTHGYITKNQ